MNNKSFVPIIRIKNVTTVYLNFAIFYNFFRKDLIIHIYKIYMYKSIKYIGYELLTFLCDTEPRS